MKRIVKLAVVLAVAAWSVASSIAFAAAEVQYYGDDRYGPPLSALGIPPDEHGEGTRAMRLSLGPHDIYGDLWAAYGWHDGEEFVLVLTRQPSGDWSKPIAEWRRASSSPMVLDGGQLLRTGTSKDVWFMFFGVAGAKAALMLAYHFDGKRLEHDDMLSDSGIIHAGEIADLNGDGIDEILFDDIDPYVFYHTANVAEISGRLAYWTGEEWAMVYPSCAGVALRKDIIRVRKLIQADLWIDAASLVHTLAIQAPEDTVLQWWSFLIQRIASSRLQHAKDSGQPFLTAVFAGDYAAAVDLMRKHPPAEVFCSADALLTGTAVSEEWHAEMAEYLHDYVRRAYSILHDDPNYNAVYALTEVFRSLEEWNLQSARGAMDLAIELAPTADYRRQAQAWRRALDGPTCSVE